MSPHQCLSLSPWQERHPPPCLARKVPGPWLEGVSGTPDLSQDTSVVALTGKAMMYSPEVSVEGTDPARMRRVKSCALHGTVPPHGPAFLPSQGLPSRMGASGQGTDSPSKALAEPQGRTYTPCNAPPSLPGCL